MKKEDTVALSKAIEFFTVIEKAAMTGCFEIIWLRIQHTAPKYSVEGCCSLISELFVLCAEILFEFSNFSFVFFQVQDV
jgi:hypothetical protein